MKTVSWINYLLIHYNHIWRQHSHLRTQVFHEQIAQYTLSGRHHQVTRWEDWNKYISVRGATTASVPVCGRSAGGSCWGPPTPACEGSSDSGTVRTRCGLDRTACPAGPVPGRTPGRARQDTAGPRTTWTPPDPHGELRRWRNRTVCADHRSTPEALQGRRAGWKRPLLLLLLLLCLEKLECLCSCCAKGCSWRGRWGRRACSGRMAAGSGAGEWGCGAPWSQSCRAPDGKRKHQRLGAWSSSSAASSCGACTCSWGSRWCAGPWDARPPACRGVSLPETWPSRSFLQRGERGLMICSRPLTVNENL